MRSLGLQLILLRKLFCFWRGGVWVLYCGSVYGHYRCETWAEAVGVERWAVHELQTKIEHQIIMRCLWALANVAWNRPAAADSSERSKTSSCINAAMPH